MEIGSAAHSSMMQQAIQPQGSNQQQANQALIGNTQSVSQEAGNGNPVQTPTTSRVEAASNSAEGGESRSSTAPDDRLPENLGRNVDTSA